MSTKAEPGPYLTFRLDAERFAISVKEVREILDPSPLTRVPSAPAHVLGVVNVRGKAVPVVSLRERFGLPPIADTNTTRIVVLELGVDGEQAVVGGRADAVEEVIDVDASMIDPAPEIASTWRSQVVTGVVRRDTDFILILDISRLFLGDGALTAMAA